MIVSVEKVLFLVRYFFGMPSEFLNAQNVEVSCNMHINLFSKLAPFLLGFESIKARLLFVKNLSLKIKREPYTI